MHIRCNTKSVLQFDITFPNIPCTPLSVDMTDISGIGNAIESRKEGIGGAKVGDLCFS